MMKIINKNKYVQKIRFQNWLKKYFKYINLGLVFGVVCALEIYFTYSKFFTKQEIEVIRTTIGNFSSGDVVIGAYLDGEYSSSIPTKSDGYTIDKVVCDNNAIGKFDTFNWQLKVSNITKKSKCNIYFIKLDSTYLDKIISQLDTTGKCPTVFEDGSVNVLTAETTNGYLCRAQDDYGESYYYRGVVTNNYVKFANFYWRIVRVNGNGTLRVIYDGKSAHTNGSSSDKKIGSSQFNSSSGSPAYVGYMYGDTNGTTYDEVHKNTNSSTIKKYIDTWYENNIKDTKYEEYVEDTIFCGNRVPILRGTYSLTSGYYENHTGYKSAFSLQCRFQNDAYTVNDTIKGNGALTYPIGLLSIIEPYLVGSAGSSNTKYYLYTGFWYYTLDAYAYYSSAARATSIDSNGTPNYYAENDAQVTRTGGVRPVINLNAQVLEQGDGTMDNPYHLTIE